MSAESPGRQVLRAFAETYPRAVFIEIGANDGLQHDHLRPFLLSLPWTGVMVEPLVWVFERLEANYRGCDGLAFENAAIADVDGRVPFYYVAPSEDRGDDAPIWSDAIGSLSQEEVEKTIAAARKFAARGGGVQIPGIESRIERTEVPCLTFESLCAKHRIEKLDLLVIDAEGYDYEIIKGIDFERHRPRLLIYESIHFSPEQREETRRHLEELGYETMDEDFDTWCHDPRASDALARRWRRVRPVEGKGRLGRLAHRVGRRLVPGRTRPQRT